MRVHEDRVHLLERQKRLEDKYKDPDVLPNFHKTKMKITMKAIEEYLRSYHGVVRAPLHILSERT